VPVKARLLSMAGSVLSIYKISHAFWFPHILLVCSIMLVAVVLIASGRTSQAIICLRGEKILGIHWASLLFSIKLSCDILFKSSNNQFKSLNSELLCQM
jgi:hypothetical protein